MTHSIPEPQASAEPVITGADVGPDPVVGAGFTLFGILMMGVFGAADAHYAFDFGVFVAVAGAGLFVVSVALSALKQRQLVSAASSLRDAAPGEGEGVDGAHKAPRDDR